MSQSALLIVGMHRSGTSAAAGALRLLGVDFARTYKAQPGVNARGFWEHEDIVDTHDDFLRQIGSGWDDILPVPPDRLSSESTQEARRRLERLVRRDFSRSAIWALKDPRVCRLLPVWIALEQPLGIELRFWHVTRAPAEVAASLARRNNFSVEKSMLLWLIHTLDGERDTRGRLRTHTTYEMLLERPVEVYETIVQNLELRTPLKVRDRTEQIHEFLSKDLRHHQAGQAPSSQDPGVFAELAARAYDALKVSEFEIPAQTSVILDSVRAELNEQMGQMNPALLEHLRFVSDQRGRYERMFFEAYHSHWWKIAWPLRSLERFLRR